MKYLIVGLGNIGAEYADTRHNIGFDVLDALAEASNTSFTTDRYGAVATLRSKGHTLVLLKPSTYMNLSGKAVRYWLDAEKIPRENLLVVVDDIALPFGTFRMRTKGSAGGHNGLKNITELLGTEEYSRIPLRHRRRLPARTPGGLRTGALERRRAQGDARTTQILRRRDSLVRRDRPRTDDESLQQEMTRRTETEKPQPHRCGFFIRRTGFSPRKR